jgi:hypothetical protein
VVSSFRSLFSGIWYSFSLWVIVHGEREINTYSFWKLSQIPQSQPSAECLGQKYNKVSLGNCSWVFRATSLSTLTTWFQSSGALWG